MSLWFSPSSVRQIFYSDGINAQGLRAWLDGIKVLKSAGDAGGKQVEYRSNNLKQMH